MKTPALVGLAVGLLGAVPVGAQVVIPERARGELGLRMGAERQKSGLVLSPQQWLRVALDGVLRNPQVGRFTIGVAPSWSQARTIGGPVDAPEQAGAWLGLDGSLQLLPSGPLNLSLEAMRSRSRDRTSFGLERRTERGNLGGTLRFQNRALPLEFSLRRDATDETLLRSGVDEFRGRGSLSTARLRLENRKTQILLERWGVDDRMLDRRSTTSLATVQRRARWGKGSSGQSRLSYRANAGGVERVTQLLWDERVHVQHTRLASSDAGFQWRRSTSRGSPTTLRTADWSLASRLFAGANGTMSLASQSLRFEGGKVDGVGVTPGIGFGARLPARAAFTASASLAFQRFTSETQGGRQVTVAGERHVVGDLGRIALDNPGVETASIEVTSPGRTRVLARGLDFDVAESGPFLELVVLPGGRIAVGDTLLVDYRYRGDPRASGHSLGASVGASLAFPHLRIYHRRSVRRPGDVVPAGDLPVRYGQRDEMVLGIVTTMRTPLGALDGTGEWNQLEIPNYTATTASLTATLRTVLPGGAQAALGIAGSRSDGTAGKQEVMRGTLSVAATPLPGLRVKSDVGGWRWARAGAPPSYMAGGGLDLLWRVGLTEFAIHYSRNWWGAGTMQTRDFLSLSAVRTF